MRAGSSEQRAEGRRYLLDRGAPSGPPPSALRPPHLARGYILFELVIALTIFSIAVLGLARSLSDSLQIVNTMNREAAIRIGLRSFLEERRKKPIADIPGAADDLRLGCTYTTTLEPANLQNRDGRTLSDLYTLTAKAAYTVGSEAQEESVMVYVYQPQQSR